MTGVVEGIHIIDVQTGNHKQMTSVLGRSM